jgi:hypothetical protein
MPNTKKTRKKSNKHSRVKYGFELNFPNEFTMKSLKESLKGTPSSKARSLTLYIRVKNALAEGLIVKDHVEAPTVKTRGRRPFVFRRIDGKDVVVSVAPVEATPVAPVVAI